MNRTLPVIGTASAVVLIDQLSKNWAVNRLSPAGSDEHINVLLGVQFRLAFNQGMAFSKFNDSGALIGLIAVTIIGGLIWFSRSVKGAPALCVVGVVIGGATGNLLDRLFRVPYSAAPGFMKGAVVDFVYTSWWPTFNVADSAVVVGGILLAIVVWQQPDPDSPTTGESPASGDITASDPTSGDFGPSNGAPSEIPSP